MTNHYSQWIVSQCFLFTNKDPTLWLVKTSLFQDADGFLYVVYTSQSAVAAGLLQMLKELISLYWLRGASKVDEWVDTPRMGRYYSFSRKLEGSWSSNWSRNVQQVEKYTTVFEKNSPFLNLLSLLIFLTFVNGA